jgi:serine/threonine protein kinase
MESHKNLNYEYLEENQTKPKITISHSVQSDYSSNYSTSSLKISLPSKSFKKIDNKFLFFKKFIIGSGSFGKVLYGMNIDQTKEFAIKFEKSSVKSSVIEEEIKILKDLKGFGVPVVYYHGKYDSYKIMVMDLLGPSLDKFFKISGKKFNMETTCYFGKEMIKRIEHVHSKGYLHRDIKPNNFMLGKLKRNSLLEDNTIYVIDFGLSKTYLEMDGLHYSYKDNRRFVGTPRYASLNTHLGIRQSRRDDLESIIYILIYFLKGDLPWQGVKAKTKSEKKEKIKQLKSIIPNNDLCKDLPEEFLIMLNYVRNLKFEEAPNYNFLVETLTKLQVAKNYTSNEDSFEFEWNINFLNSKKFYLTDDRIYSHFKNKFEKLYEGYAYMSYEEYLNLLENKKINSTIDKTSLLNYSFEEK